MGLSLIEKILALALIVSIAVTTAVILKSHFDGKDEDDDSE